MGSNITGTSPNEFTIPATAQLYVNGATLTSSNSTGSWNGFTIYGKLKIVAGTVTTPANTNGIFYGSDGTTTPVLEISGGDLYATQIRPYSSSTKFQYLQTGGTVHFDNLANDDSQSAVFHLNNANHIFEMTGGTMSFKIANAANGWATGIRIESGVGNYEVTGGTIEITENATRDFKIFTTVPLYNITTFAVGGVSTKTQVVDTWGTPGDASNPGNLKVVNNLTIASGTQFVDNGGDVNIGGDLTINGTFTQTGKLTFDGSKDATVTNGSGSTFSFGNLNVNKDIHPTSGSFYKLTLSGANGYSVTNNINLYRGKLDIVNFDVNTAGNIEIVDGDLTSSGTGSLVLNGSTAQQTIKGADGAEQNFGRLKLNNTYGTAPQIKLLSNVNATSVTFVAASQVFDLGIYNLELSASNYSSWGWSTTSNRYFLTSGLASDGGLTLPVTAGTYSDALIQLFPMATAGGYSPVAVYGTTSINSGLITVKPVNNYHPTVSATSKSTQYYWKINHTISGAGATKIRYKMYCPAYIKTNYNSLIVLNNANWYNDSGTESSNTLTFNPGYTASNYITGDFTVGNQSGVTKPTVYYSRTSGSFNNKNTWSVTSHTGVATNQLPAAYDFLIIGGAAGVNHTVTITADNADASQVYIKGISETGISGTPPTLKVNSGTSGHDIDIIDGKGKLVFEDNSGSWAISNLINGDYSSFCNNTESIFEYAGTSGYRIAPVATIPYYPNLYISGNTANTKYSRNDGSLIIKGDLYVNDGLFAIDNYYNGVVKIGDSLKINSGTLTLSNQGTQNAYVENSIAFTGNGTLKTGDSGSENNLYVKGDITLVNGSTLDFSTNDRKTNVVFYGDNSATVSRTTGAGTTNFYRFYVNKPVGKKVQFTTMFASNGPKTDANKAIVLQSGECHLNNSSINISLSTGGNPFKIPTGTTLRVDNGSRVNVGGSDSNTGIWLDGALVVDNAGKVYCNQGSGGFTDNYIEYTPSGTASIWLGANAELLVGSQLRRTTTSDAGALQFTQAKSSSVVTLGMNSAPTSNRGVFEVLNTGSSFTQTESGSNITIVRGQTSASVPTLFFNPASVSIATGAGFTLGNASTPASANMGLYSAVELKNLTIGSTNNPTVTVQTQALTIGGNLVNGGTLNTGGYALTLKGNFTNNGTFVPAANTTYFSGTADQSISGTTPVSFYNLTKSSSNTLTLSSSSVTVNNDLSIGTETPYTLGGTINTGAFDLNVKRNLAVFGTVVSSGASNGVVCNGTALQELSGSATFGRLTLDNTNGVDVPTQGYPINFTDSLMLNNGVLNIGKNLITFDNDAKITSPSGFSSSRMVQTNLSFTDNGIKKTLPSGTWDALTPFTFVYPIGSAGKYTPVTLKVTQNGNSTGTVRVKAANEKHISIQNDPLTTIDETKNVLQYNWTLDANGVSGFTGVAQMDFIGSDALVTGTNLLSQYITARILLNSTSWNKFDANDFDEVANTMIFKYSGTGDSGIDGDYTAGITSCIPDNVPSYISIANSDWTDVNTWALYTPSTNTIGAAGVGVPAGGPRGSVVYINTTVTMPTNFMAAYRTNINSSGVLSTGASFGHRLGDVDGTGTLKLESGNLPAGVYDHFFSAAGGTLEFAGTGSYSVLSEVTSLNNLKFSGSGDRNLPNIGFTVLGNFTLAGGACKNPHNTNFAVNGNVSFTGGSFDSNLATVSLNGSSLQTVSGTNHFSSTNSFYNLLVNNAAGVNLLNNVEVANNLTLTNGVVNTELGGSLTLTNLAPTVCSGGSSTAYVEGELRKNINNSSYFDFPVGDNARYGGLIRVTTNGSSQGLWKMRYLNHAAANDGYSTMVSPVVFVSGNEYWSVTAPNTSCVADLVLPWDSNSGVNPTQAGTYLVAYKAAGWTQYPTWSYTRCAFRQY